MVPTLVHTYPCMISEICGGFSAKQLLSVPLVVVPQAPDVARTTLAHGFDVGAQATILLWVHLAQVQA